jgi:hypothetical protein
LTFLFSAFFSASNLAMRWFAAFFSASSFEICWASFRFELLAAAPPLPAAVGEPLPPPPLVLRW